MNEIRTEESLLQENDWLRTQLEEQEPYRVMVEAISEGAVTLAQNGTILYCNKRFADLVRTPLEQNIGHPLREMIATQDSEKFDSVLANGSQGDVRAELMLQASDGTLIRANFFMCPLLKTGGRGIAILITDLTGVADATEAREWLHESDDKFKYLFEHSPIGKSLTAPSGEIQVNRAFCEMVGYSEQELQSRRWQDLTHPDDIELTQRALDPILTGTQESGRFIKRYLHKDGRVVWADVSTFLRRDKMGNPVYFMTHVMDITERKLVEEELRAASSYVRSLIEASLDPLVTINTSGKITDVNEATVQATGLARTALIGSDFSCYFTEPDKARAGYQEVLAKGQVRDYPLTLSNVSGNVMEVLYNASVYRNRKGEVMGIFAAARDITERKMAEEATRREHVRLRRFIDSNIVGIVIATSAGAIVEANDNYLGLIGFTRDELEQGKVDWRAITPPEWLAVDEKAIRELHERGTCTPYEKEYVRRDGSRVPIFLADTMLPGPEEQIAAFVLDITDRKRAEMEISKLNAELEQRVAERTAKLEVAYKDLESFAYSVSHDLRTPLRAIDGFSQQVLMHYANKLDDEGKRYLNVVRDNARKMSQLIDDILAFSRMGRLEIALAEVGMEMLSREVCEELKQTVDGRELSIEIMPLPSCRGDLAMLHQVWVNLLGNAIKFTKYKRPARIEVGGRTEGAEIIYYVRDNGAGYDMQYADKLFGVFQRLHGNEEFEGTGIGLAIVKRIVTRLGGRVWAEGRVNEGATFYFALPLNS